MIQVDAADCAIQHLLWPKSGTLMPKCSEINVEFMFDNGWMDMVNERSHSRVRMARAQ
jgi:hypothetical protein